MMMNKILIVDGDNMLHRAYHKYGGFTNIEGKPSSMIFGFPYMLRSALTRIKPTKVYVVFDGGRSEHRVKVLPDYKKRDQKLGFDYEDFQDQKSVVKQLVQDLAIMVVWGKGLEADDLIYMIARRHRHDSVVILSGDKDFHQSIGPNLTVFSPQKEIELTEKNLKNYYWYQPHQVVDYLCLTGDKSDKIPGYGGVGEVRAKQFIERFGSIKDFLRTHNKGMTKTLDPVKLKVAYARNRTLIDLAYFYRKFHRKKITLPIVNPDPIFKLAAVAMVSRKYGVTTLTKADFISAFKTLANV